MKRAYYLLPQHTDIFRVAHWCQENGMPALFPIHDYQPSKMVGGEFIQAVSRIKHIGSRHLASIYEQTGRRKIPIQKDSPKRFVILRDEDVVLFRLRFA